jgi:hypothetical protein
MAEIVHFKSKAELTALQNVVEFVRLCRDDLTALGADLPFDRNVWDISEHIESKGRTKAVRVVFSSLAAAKASKATPTMSPNFLPFAKAYFRYWQGLKPTTAWANRLAALRVLDSVLCDEGHNGDVTATTGDLLTQACNVVIQQYSAALAPKLAGALEDISNFLIANELAQMPTRWVKPIRKEREQGLRVGAVADAAREKKMPSAAAIEAMAHVFVHASEPLEVYLGSTLALLHCAPQRINETVRLRVGCEVEEPDSEGRIQYGLRWPGSKGYENSIKWILPTMVGVARLAIKRLLGVTAEARNIASWYEKNPTEIYLPEQIKSLRRKSWLKPSEVSSILFGDSDPVISEDWCIKNKVRKKDGIYSFADVQTNVLKRMPKAFPLAQPGLKYSEALFIVRRFELDATLRMYTCLVDYLPYDQICSRLGKSGSTVKTEFEVFNLTEDDGSPISLTSHQIRHYLNTLAQANHASQLDIAMWSGRADIKQNAPYNHTTPDQILSNTRELAIATNSPLFGGDLSVPKPRVIAIRDVSGVLRTGSAHITDYGMCTHDYAMPTCELHRDCLNCNELVCVKGDTVKTQNIRFVKDETENLLKEAELAESTSVYGASRWVTHHRETLEHCVQLLSILDNPLVEIGALVKLTGIQPASRIAQAEEARNGPSVKAIPAGKNKLLERLKRG